MFPHSSSQMVRRVSAPGHWWEHILVSLGGIGTNKVTQVPTTDIYCVLCPFLKTIGLCV